MKLTEYKKFVVLGLVASVLLILLFRPQYGSDSQRSGNDKDRVITPNFPLKGDIGQNEDESEREGGRHSIQKVSARAFWPPTLYDTANTPKPNRPLRIVVTGTFYYYHTLLLFCDKGLLLLLCLCA